MGSEERPVDDSVTFDAAALENMSPAELIAIVLLQQRKEAAARATASTGEQRANDGQERHREGVAEVKASAAAEEQRRLNTAEEERRADEARATEEAERKGATAIWDNAVIEEQRASAERAAGAARQAAAEEEERKKEEARRQAAAAEQRRRADAEIAAAAAQRAADEKRARVRAALLQEERDNLAAAAEEQRRRQAALAAEAAQRAAAETAAQEQRRQAAALAEQQAAAEAAREDLLLAELTEKKRLRDAAEAKQRAADEKREAETALRDAMEETQRAADRLAAYQEREKDRVRAADAEYNALLQEQRTAAEHLRVASPPGGHDGGGHQQERPSGGRRNDQRERRQGERPAPHRQRTSSRGSRGNRDQRGDHRSGSRDASRSRSSPRHRSRSRQRGRDRSRDDSREGRRTSSRGRGQSRDSRRSNSETRQPAPDLDAEARSNSPSSSRNGDGGGGSSGGDSDGGGGGGGGGGKRPGAAPEPEELRKFKKLQKANAAALGASKPEFNGRSKRWMDFKDFVLGQATFAGIIEVLSGEITIADVGRDPEQLSLFNQHNRLAHVFLQQSVGPDMQHFVRSEPGEVERRDGAALWARLCASYDLRSAELGLEASLRFADTSSPDASWDVARESPVQYFARQKSMISEITKHGFAKPDAHTLIMRALHQLPKTAEYQLLRTSFTSGEGASARLQSEEGLLQLETQMQATWLSSGAGTAAARSANRRGGSGAPALAVEFPQQRRAAGQAPDRPFQKFEPRYLTAGRVHNNLETHRRTTRHFGPAVPMPTRRSPPEQWRAQNSFNRERSAPGGGPRPYRRPNNSSKSFCRYHGSEVAHTEQECLLNPRNTQNAAPNQRTAFRPPSAAAAQVASQDHRQSASVDRSEQPPFRRERAQVSALVVDSCLFSSNSADNAAEDSSHNIITWVVDTGAGAHMVGAADGLYNIRTMDADGSLPRSICGVGGSLSVTGVGDYKGLVPLSKGGTERQASIEFKDVLIVPGLRWNLLSVLALQQAGMSTHLSPTAANVDASADILTTGEEMLPLLLRNSHWTLTTSTLEENGTPRSPMACDALIAGSETHRIYHERFGHVNDQQLEQLRQAGALKLPRFAARPFCNGCQLGKLVHADMSKEPRVPTTRPLERLHSDIVGPISPTARDGSRYALVVVDDFTHYVWTYPIKTKDEMVGKMQSLLQGLCAQGDKVGALRCDSGSEYKSAEFRALFSPMGTKMEYSAPYQHNQNGLAERIIGTIASRCRTMLHAGGAPAIWWSDAMQQATLVTNLLPTRALPGAKDTPYFLWYGNYGPIERLRVFWCPSWVAIEGPRKMGARARMGHYLGPAPESKGDRIYMPNTKRIVESVHVKFNEDALDAAKAGAFNSASSTFTVEAPGAQSTSEKRQTARRRTAGQEEASDDDSDFEVIAADAPAAEGAAKPEPSIRLFEHPQEEAPSFPAGVVPMPGYDKEIMGHNLIGKRVAIKWTTGWYDGEVVGFVKKRVKQYDIQWEGEPNSRLSSLQRAHYATVPEAKLGSWFVVSPTQAPVPSSTEQATPTLDGLSVRALAALLDEGKTEELTLDHIYAAMASHEATAREGSTWPNRLCFTDFADYAQSVAAKYEHTTRQQAPLAFAATTDTRIPRDPLTYKEAMDSPFKENWIASMGDEMGSLESNKTFKRVILPKGARLVGSKWVYKTKLKPDGSIERFKARLVAKGFSQVAGVDFDPTMTHAPVVRHTSLRLTMCYAIARGWKLDQMDVTTAYLQSELDEPIYLRMPPGFEEIGTSGECLLLLRSLYGLRQAGNNWNRLMDGWLKVKHFTPSGADPCLYIKKDALGRVIMIVCLYVDDLLIASPTEELANGFKADITKAFKMKDLGALSFLLGMEIKTDYEKGTIELSQQKYIREMLELYDMSDCKPVPTPALEKSRLTKAMSPQTEEVRNEMRNQKYRHGVGHVMYLALVSRFDIMNAVRELARFMEDPGPEHLAALKHLFRFLKGTQDMTLCYGPFASTDFKVVGFSDSDWAGELDSRRSTTGYAFMLSTTNESGTVYSGAISVNSRLQPTVALSSTEAEYMAVCSATQEAIYLRSMLADLGLPQVEPTIIFEDNTAAIALANAALGQWHPRTRHVDVRYKFVKERVRSHEVELVYVKTHDQIADLLTKNLGTTQFRALASRLLGHQ